MVTKLIPIPSNDNKIYRQILAVLNFITGLTGQELDVLAEIIKLNHEYIALPSDKRAKFILSTEIRKEMREVLQIEEKTFNGLIARLKKKKFMGTAILDEIGILHQDLLFRPDEEGFKIEVRLNKTLAPIENPQTKVLEVKENIVEPVKSTEIPAGRPENYKEEEQFDFTIAPPQQ